MIEYTEALHRDIFERLRFQAECNATKETKPAISILEASAMWGEITRLQEENKKLQEQTR